MSKHLRRSAVVVALLLGGASTGCETVDKKSSLSDAVTKPPSDAFMKRVEKDPFPSAGQAMPAGKQTPTKR